MQEDADIQLVMDDTSDAATADSVPQLDGKALVEDYHEPNSAYPHASSLRSPMGIAQMKGHPEYDFHDNNDLAMRVAFEL